MAEYYKGYQVITKHNNLESEIVVREVKPSGAAKVVKRYPYRGVSDFQKKVATRMAQQHIDELVLHKQLKQNRRREVRG